MSNPTERLGDVDAAISRWLHTMNRPATNKPVSALSHGLENAVEHAVLETAERFLEDGLEMLQWWKYADQRDSYAQRFDLQRTFNRADSSYGFFDEIELRGNRIRVMGSVQEMLYDNPRVPAEFGPTIVIWIREQVRAFVLRYFMRVSDFRQPESAENFKDFTRPSPPPGFGRLSWCDRADALRSGFGFTQLFYKLRANGKIGKFPDDQAFTIVDLREIGSTYEWIIVKVRIFDFDLRFRPFGQTGPEVVFSLNEESYLILSPDLVIDLDNPEPGVVGDYGVGYAFIKTPESGFLAYGPGRFDAAVEVIRFRVLSDGQVRVNMLFLANRPASIASVSLDPIDWAVWAMDGLSAGAASELFRPIRNILDRRPLRVGTFDPIYLYVSLANLLSSGEAAQQLCISREALDKQFLVQHFKQHYQAIVGSLLTWRQIADWTDDARLPPWVLIGTSS